MSLGSDWYSPIPTMYARIAVTNDIKLTDQLRIRIVRSPESTKSNIISIHTPTTCNGKCKPVTFIRSSLFYYHNLLWSWKARYNNNFWDIIIFVLGHFLGSPCMHIVILTFRLRLKNLMVSSFDSSCRLSRCRSSVIAWKSRSAWDRVPSASSAEDDQFDDVDLGIFAGIFAPSLRSSVDARTSGSAASLSASPSFIKRTPWCRAFCRAKFCPWTNWPQIPHTLLVYGIFTLILLVCYDTADPKTV